MIAILAKTSFRADKNAALVKLPSQLRNLANIQIHRQLTIKAPSATIDNSNGFGGL